MATYEEAKEHMKSGRACRLEWWNVNTYIEMVDDTIVYDDGEEFVPSEVELKSSRWVLMTNASDYDISDINNYTALLNIVKSVIEGRYQQVQTIYMWRLRRYLDEHNATGGVDSLRFYVTYSGLFDKWFVASTYLDYNPTVVYGSDEAVMRDSIERFMPILNEITELRKIYFELCQAKQEGDISRYTLCEWFNKYNYKSED